MKPYNFQNPRGTNFKEVNSVIELKDSKGYLRFKVIFNKRDDVDEKDYVIKTHYVVKVVSFYGKDNPLVIYDKKYKEYQEARHDFEGKVRLYETFVKAQNRGIDDIEVFSEKIMYHKVFPNCCLNCKFCKNDCGHLRCHNYENFADYSKLSDCGDLRYKDHEMYDLNYENYPIYHDVPMHPKHFPPTPRPDDLHIDLHPRVDHNGICKNYEKRPEGDTLPLDLEDRIQEEIYKTVQREMEKYKENN